MEASSWEIIETSGFSSTPFWMMTSIRIFSEARRWLRFSAQDGHDGHISSSGNRSPPTENLTPNLLRLWPRSGLGSAVTESGIRDTNENIGKGPQIFVYGMLNKMDQTTGYIQCWVAWAPLFQLDSDSLSLRIMANLGYPTPSFALFRTCLL